VGAQLEASVLKGEYVLLHQEKASAQVTFGNRQTAELRKLDIERYSLSNQSQTWLLNRKVDGEVRPFSIAAFRASSDGSKKGEEVMKIKDHLFVYGGHFYMLGGIPEGGIPKNNLSGSKYICRLSNFPFSHPDQVDAETKNRLKKHRGVPAGEFYGLGSRGFHVKLDDELDGIGLPLAASAFLIYSSI
jgi:hypothetical protein